MTDYNRTTKAELIKLLETEQEKNKNLEEKTHLDMSFKPTSKELSDKQKAQNRKDLIKRATRGRWVSEVKFEEVLRKQQEAMRYGQ